MTAFIIAQIMSILNGAFLLKSMRAKDKKKFLIFNSTSNLFGCLSMVILGAYAAAIGPIVLTIQGLLTHYYETKGKKVPKFILPLCIGLNIFGGMLTFNSLLCLLPIISSTLASVMLSSKNMKIARRINLASSIIALPYLITNKAYVAALIFGSNFLNTLDAIYRIDYKEAKKEKTEEDIEAYEESHDLSKEKDQERQVEDKEIEDKIEITPEDIPVVYKEEQVESLDTYGEPITRKRIIHKSKENK